MAAIVRSFYVGAFATLMALGFGGGGYTLVQAVRHFWR